MFLFHRSAESTQSVQCFRQRIYKRANQLEPKGWSKPARETQENNLWNLHSCFLSSYSGCLKNYVECYIPWRKASIGSNSHQNKQNCINWSIDKDGIQEWIVGDFPEIAIDLKERQDTHQKSEHNYNEVLNHKLYYKFSTCTRSVARSWVKEDQFKPPKQGDTCAKYMKLNR